MKLLLHYLLYLLLLLPAHILLAQEQQVKVTKIAPNVFIHTTYKEVGGVVFPSHGMVISTKDGVVLIDTGWGNEPTEQLLAWVKANLKQPVRICVATHWHEDKMGGIDAVQTQAIPVVTSRLTATLAAERKKGIPDITFAQDTTFTVGRQQFKVYYPGGGHTLDNVVVYLPQQKILFGGCLVKDVHTNNLGNISDADLENWPNTIRNVQQQFPDTKVVISSHGPWGNQSLLSHTLKLLQQ